MYVPHISSLWHQRKSDIIISGSGVFDRRHSAIRRHANDVADRFSLFSHCTPASPPHTHCTLFTTCLFVCILTCLTASSLHLTLLLLTAPSLPLIHTTGSHCLFSAEKKNNEICRKTMNSKQSGSACAAKNISASSSMTARQKRDCA